MNQQIFAPEPQAVMDLGQTIQHGMEFPATLAERYQPRRLDDFIGITRPKTMLRNLAAKPRACGLLFVGPPGSGKTALGMAFAEELPGSLIHIPAQKCDVARLDDLRDQTAYMPPTGKFWVVLIDEADQMTEKAQLQLLSRLDGTASLKPVFGGGFERGTPPPIIWIMTCNGRGPQETDVPSTLLPRFVSRCLLQPFEAVNQAELAAYLERLWTLEQGGATPQGYFEHVAMGVGVRDALMRLETDLLSGPRPVPVDTPAVDVPVAAFVPSHKPRSALTTQDERRSNAALKAWATRRRMAMAK
jgi:hypothetical protein